MKQYILDFEQYLGHVQGTQWLKQSKLTRQELDSLLYTLKSLKKGLAAPLAERQYEVLQEKSSECLGQVKCYEKYTARGLSWITLFAFLSTDKELDVDDKLKFMAEAKEPR